MPSIVIACALPLVSCLGAQTAAAGHFAVGAQTATSPSWLPVAGAVGAVLGACIAGAIGFLGSWYTQRRQRELASLALEHQRAQLFNERFATAADKLGHAEAATRIAGVYALAGLADDWISQRQTCIDVLCGYMRLPYQPQVGKEGFRVGEREIRDSLVRIIRDHLRDNATVSWQGYTFRFYRATFDGGDLSHIRISNKYMSFYGAEFVSGTLDFRGSNFSGGEVSFLDARFSGGAADFRGATFAEGSKILFPGAVFSAGSTIDFRAANFSGGEVDLAQGKFAGGIVDLRDPRDSSLPAKIPEPPPGEILLSN
jgi:hypothetical protein